MYSQLLFVYTQLILVILVLYAFHRCYIYVFMKFNTCREARSVIEQIALSLAAAESALQFEHRDLHWHNVLVRPTRQWKLRYRVGGVSYAVFTEGIQVTIIDFTVSRLCHGTDCFLRISRYAYRMFCSIHYYTWNTIKGFFVSYLLQVVPSPF